MLSPRLVRHLSYALPLFALFGIVSPAAAFAQNPATSNLIAIADLERKAAGISPVFLRVEGIVRGIAQERGLLALQDDSGTTLLEVPELNSTVKVGDRMAIEASPGVLSRTRFGVRMGNIPVVENDGLHPEAEKSGSVFLEAGMNPICVDWFNGPAEFSLNVEFEGPGIQRQKVPGSILWHDPAVESQDLQRGVYCQAYEGPDWMELPDFSALNPTAAVIATNFSVSYRTRDQQCGLSFRGLIQIDRPGSYTFYLRSDDGSRLYAGKSSITQKVVRPADSPMPAPESLEEAMANHSINHWIQMEGEVTFASQSERSLILEMMAGGDRVPVTVVDGWRLFRTNLLHSWIQVQGICEFSRDPAERRLVEIFVPGAGQVKIYNPMPDARGGASEVLLTNAFQVRQLKAMEAGKHVPAKIRGVVIYDSPRAAVLHDASGGVFIGCRDGFWSEQPKMGELWEMEGITDPGLFSPVIVADKARFLGYGPLPVPLIPRREQLMNGNMDAEYGELHGVISEVSSNEIGLLTSDGRVSVVGIPERPLPQLPQSVPPGSSLVGSVVRIRGCFATLVDTQTRQVTPGKVYIYPGTVEVEDPMPQDPFQSPARTPSDLMWFNAPDLALQRTKLAGQVINSRPGEYFVQDGKTGFRALTADRSMKVGDLIEAVGFPKLDGPSPVLHEAQVRKIGQAMLPNPILVSSEQLLDRDLDSRMVKVNALLIGDVIHQSERVLELQSGVHHFSARLESVTGTGDSLPAGCRLQLTGVYASAAGDPDRVSLRLAPFELLLNRSADIVVLQRPPWWTIERVVMVLVALSGVLSAMFIWVALLRRRVEQRTAQLKNEIEQRQLVEQHHAIELERTRVARDLHDELGAGLTEVGLLGSLANTPAVEPEAKTRYLDQLTQMARSLVTSLDEIVWAVNPHHDSLASLVSYFSLYAESFLNLAGITCRLRVAEQIPEFPLDSKQRHGIFCVFKEALNNLVRHSGASEAQVAFEVSQGKLVLSVIDNGCGFTFVPGEPGKDGLASLHQRIQELGGICAITSRPGSGTTVQISLPLNQNQHGQSSDR